MRDAPEPRHRQICRLPLAPQLATRKHPIQTCDSLEPQIEKPATKLAARSPREKQTAAPNPEPHPLQTPARAVCEAAHALRVAQAPRRTHRGLYTAPRPLPLRDRTTCSRRTMTRTRTRRPLRTRHPPRLLPSATGG
eukprot:8925178-Alexandrium_andersonii.AAC.1